MKNNIITLDHADGNGGQNSTGGFVQSLFSSATESVNPLSFIVNGVTGIFSTIGGVITKSIAIVNETIQKKDQLDYQYEKDKNDWSNKIVNDLKQNNNVFYVILGIAVIALIVAIIIIAAKKKSK